MMLNYARRTATVIGLCGLASFATAGPLAGVASAATSPTISYNDMTGGISGSGFTPGGKALVQEYVQGDGTVAATTVTATKPWWLCSTFCFYVGGGQISATLPSPEGSLGCAEIKTGIIYATDLTTGSEVSKPVTWEGMC